MIAVLLLLCILLLWVILSNTEKAAIDKDVPVYSGSLPLIGITLKGLVDTTKCWLVMKFVTEDVSRHGGVMKLNLFLIPHYIITDPEAAETVVNSCLDRHFVYNFTIPVFGKSLLGSPAPVWKRHRKLLNPAFNLTILYGFVERFNDQAKKLVVNLDALVGKGPFIATHYIRDNVLKGVCSTTVGDSNIHDDETIREYSKALSEVTKMFAERMKNILQHSDIIYKLCGYKNKLDNYRRIIADVSDKIIEEAKIKMKNRGNSNSLNNHQEDHTTILNKYMELNVNNTLTYEELREEIYFIIAAAFDTTSLQLENILHLIGSHPEIQENVFKEVTLIIGQEGKITKEDLQKLVYTEAVVKESLRLFPAVPFIGRSINHDVQLKNCTLRGGAYTFISLYDINRHTSWGPDADEFKPERWLEPSVTNLCTFASFSIGKRNCIGKTYALMSLKIFLAYLVRRYRIEADYTKIQYKWDMVLTPAKGHEISLKLRNTS